MIHSVNFDKNIRDIQFDETYGVDIISDDDERMISEILKLIKNEF